MLNLLLPRERTRTFRRTDDRRRSETGDWSLFDFLLIRERDISPRSFPGEVADASSFVFYVLNNARVGRIHGSPPRTRTVTKFDREARFICDLWFSIREEIVVTNVTCYVFKVSPRTTFF